VAVADATRSTVAIGTRTNTVFTAPPGITNGDLLVILMSAGAAAAVTVTPPSGWSTLSGGPLIVNSKADPWTQRGYVFYKVASGESGNYTTSHSSAATDGIIIRFTGADTTTPFNPTQTTSSGSGTTTSWTGLTTAVDGSGVVAFSIAWDGQGGSAPTGTTPTFTEQFDGGTTGTSYVADGVLATAGATGTKTNTNNNTGGAGSPWAASLIAIAAGAAATGAPGEEEGCCCITALRW
jgi:hypothetical protein